LIDNFDDSILDIASRLIKDKQFYKKMKNSYNLYGDGKSSEHIGQIVGNYFDGIPIDS